MRESYLLGTKRNGPDYECSPKLIYRVRIEKVEVEERTYMLVSKFYFALLYQNVGYQLSLAP
jgi:hypothetical protein